MSHDPRLLRLAPEDNILTVVRPIEPGETFTVNGAAVTAAQRLPLGHKVAARALAAGEKILKHSVPIGSAKCAIAAGEHVHTHNLGSDYLPTFLRDQPGPSSSPTPPGNSQM